MFSFYFFIFFILYKYFYIIFCCFVHLKWGFLSTLCQSHVTHSFACIAPWPRQFWMRWSGATVSNAHADWADFLRQWLSNPLLCVCTVHVCLYVYMHFRYCQASQIATVWAALTATIFFYNDFDFANYFRVPCKTRQNKRKQNNKCSTVYSS